MNFRSLFEKSQRYAQIFDWVLASGSFGYGVYTHNWWWIAGGMIGFGVAWYNPGARLRKRLAFVKPRPPA